MNKSNLKYNRALKGATLVYVASNQVLVKQPLYVRGLVLASTVLINKCIDTNNTTVLNATMFSLSFLTAANAVKEKQHKRDIVCNLLAIAYGGYSLYKSSK